VTIFGELSLIEDKGYAQLILQIDPFFPGKESNNLDESMVFGVQENDSTLYLDDKAKRMKKQDMEEFILHLSPKIARIYRISERRLRDWQKCIENKIPFDISKKNLKKLYRIKKT
jgi:hypothetical protein